MGHTTATRYPNYMGDIDRTWLVEQLPKAKYPNALLEIALHPYYSSSLCNFAYVTDDVLIDFVLGEDTLSAGEFSGLLRGLSNYKRENVDFMVSENLSICNDAQRIQQAKGILQSVAARRGHPALGLIYAFLNTKNVPTSAVDNAERFQGWSDSWDEWDRINNLRKFRQKPLKCE